MTFPWKNDSCPDIGINSSWILQIGSFNKNHKKCSEIIICLNVIGKKNRIFDDRHIKVM